MLANAARNASGLISRRYGEKQKGNAKFSEDQPPLAYL
jgi:hypothetical protein